MKHYPKSAFKVVIRDTALYRQSDLYIKCFNHHILHFFQKREAVAKEKRSLLASFCLGRRL
jgi:hypothetical protein